MVKTDRAFSMKSVVDRLVQTSRKMMYHPTEGPDCQPQLPSRSTCIEAMQDLRSVLFPGYFGLSDFSDQGMSYQMGALLDSVSIRLKEQVRRGCCFVCVDKSEFPKCNEKATNITQTFLNRLPDVMDLLAEDVQAAYEGDPAARSPGEAIFCYPGLLAITNHRVAHELYKLGVNLIPRIISEQAHSVTGIDIHPGARIGKKFFIDHGTGVVIGETTVIGERVRLYQGVTLGAKSFPLDKNGNPIKGIDRHPIIEDDVVVYAGATILGRVTIGKGSTIGGNVWLTNDVPTGSVVTSQKGSKLGLNGS